MDTVLIFSKLPDGKLEAQASTRHKDMDSIFDYNPSTICHASINFDLPVICLPAISPRAVFVLCSFNKYFLWLLRRNNAI